MDVSDAWALLAIQGPKAVGIVQKLTSIELDTVAPYRFTTL